MKKCKSIKIYVLVLLLLFVANQYVVAQSRETCPKIGLTLSGGGAKGLAHLGLLQMIDSLNIKIDYITGTSMGAILGGLYASGISAKDIKTICYNIDWERVISDKMPLSQISINEKSEYRQYLFELPIKKGLPTIPSSITEGHYISSLFNEYTYHVSNIFDFDSLPIPIHIMTSDITIGGTIVQKKGSLPTAIRASMAIPGAFEPFYIGNNMLVDGGLDNNFPVLEAKNMGADIVIGSYTGYKMFFEGKIDDVAKILSRAVALKSVDDAKYQMRYCDILLNLNVAIDKYNVADFASFKEIIEIGEQEARKIQPQLVEIAEMQRQCDFETRNINKNITNNISKINYFYQNNQPITDKSTASFLNSITSLKPNSKYDFYQIQNGVDKIFGTNLFHNAYFNISEDTNNKQQLNIFIKEKKTGLFKLAVHYDTEEKTGLLLNYTFYNLLGKRSRSLFTFDLSERIKAQLNHYQFFDPSKNYWYKIKATYKNLNSNNIILKTDDLRSSRQPNYNKGDLIFSAGLGYLINNNSNLEFNFLYEQEHLNTQKNAFDNVIDVYKPSNFYGHSGLAINLTYRQNNLETSYYPKSGNRTYFELKYSFNNEYKLKGLNIVDTNSYIIYDYINPISMFYTKPNPKTFLRGLFSYEHRFLILPKLTFGVNSSVGFFIAKGKFLKSTDYMYFNNIFTLGGYCEKELNSNISFIGLNERELPLNGFLSLTLNAQYNVYNKIYLTPMVSYAWSVDNINIFSNIPNHNFSVWGVGINIGYMSIIGPVNLSIGKAIIWNELRLPYRASLSIGYKF